jgi:hypothetical protein
MALSKIEQQLTGGIPHRTCSVCHHMNERGLAWKIQLQGLLANRGVKFKDLAAALAVDPDEPDIPWEALSRHARGGCAAKETLR